MAEASLKEKTKKGLYWKFFDQAAGQLMQFTVGVIMARLLSPDDFGVAAIPTVFISIAMIFTDSGFGVALIRKPELTNKDLSTSFYYSIGMGVFMYALLFIAAPFIADFYDRPILTSLVRVVSLNFLWGPLNTPQSVILHRKVDFKTPARISIVNKIVAGAAGIAIAYAGYGVWALVASTIISSLMGLFQIWLAVKWVPTEPFSRESFKYLWNYGNKMIGANLIDRIYGSMTPFLVGKVYSTQILGFYERAWGYAKLPANQMSSLLSSVTLPVLSKMQDNTESLTRNYRKMIRTSTFITFPIFMLMCALARPLIIVLVTEKWAFSIQLLQILCFGLMWWPLQSINKNLLQVLGRSDLYLKNEIYKKSIMFVMLCASLPFGIKVFAVSYVLQNLVALYINTYYTGHLINYSLKSQLKDIYPSFLLSLTILAIVFPLKMLFTSPIIQIVVGGTVGSATYIGLAYLFKFTAIHDVKYMLKRK